MSGNLYLTGFMASGKSSAGRELARMLGRRFVDLDEQVAKRAGMSVQSIFAQKGEEAFRRVEHMELKRAARGRGLVVATGGGLPVPEHNRAAMRESGRIVNLAARLETCRSRLGKEAMAERPLWRDADKVAGLYEARKNAYADCDLRLNVDGLCVEDTALAIARELLPDWRGKVILEGRACPVVGSLDAPAALEPIIKGRRLVLITDRNLAGLHLARYQNHLGPDSLILTVPAGEKSKSLASAGKLMEAMSRARIGRGDLVLALGGGMITDLGAFVAATYMRGMDFALASTTLLGCVDAAIGGKAAVNLTRVKNLVGAFTRPLMVVQDWLALSSLTRGRRVEGISEAYKTGLVADADLAADMEKAMPLLLKGDLPLLADVAQRAAKLKAGIVSRDFREGGLRKVLNLGHTYGHALESLSGYRVSHGKAVAAGMITAAVISQRRGLLSGAEAARISETMAPLAPKPEKWPGADEAWPLMLRDKKNHGGKVSFVLLKSIGKPLVKEDLTQEELAKALAEIKAADHG